MIRAAASTQSFGIRLLKSWRSEMFDNIFSILILVGIGTLCWVMVFKPAARRKLNEWAYEFWHVPEEDRDSWEAVSLATNLILAMVFSLVIIVVIVVGISQWFGN